MVMCDNLEIIKTRNLYLKDGVPSDEIVLVDAQGEGDMYFTFIIKYVNGKGVTHFNAQDNFHASIIIETSASALTKTERPFLVGKYGNDRDLFVGFVVNPSNSDGDHNMVITFYTNKK